MKCVFDMWSLHWYSFWYVFVCLFVCLFVFQPHVKTQIVIRILRYVRLVFVSADRDTLNLNQIQMISLVMVSFEGFFFAYLFDRLFVSCFLACFVFAQNCWCECVGLFVNLLGTVCFLVSWWPSNCIFEKLPKIDFLLAQKCLIKA